MTGTLSGSLGTALQRAATANSLQPMNVVHIGLPKCASTTLQNRLFAQQRAFTYVGWINKGYRNSESTKDLIARITFQDSLDYDHAATEAMLRGLPEVTAAPGRPILMSAESLSVEGRADRRLVAERLHRLFAPAKVLIVLRAQPAMLQSMYLHHIRGERITSFEHWLDQNYGGIRFMNLRRIGLDYEPLVRAYDEFFGPDNVVVLPFELISDENSVFHTRLAEMLQLPLADVHACFRQNVDNRRMSKRHLLALYVQGSMPTGTNLATLGRRLLPTPLYQQVRSIVVGGKRLEAPQLSERWCSRVAAACARGNARLEARTGLPLGALGYPV